MDLGHADLQGKLVSGATFIGCNPSCGNGDWRGPDGVAQPSDNHGTHVSGIAAAATNNGIGIAGVAPDASIMPVKVLEDGSGSFEDIANGVRWAADHGADVVNMSLGGLQGTQVLSLTGLESSLQDAILYARGKGVAIIAAAGNDSVPLCNSPGFDEGVLCVVSTDKRELRSAFSLRPDPPRPQRGLRARRLAGPGLRRGHRLDRPGRHQRLRRHLRLRQQLRRVRRHLDGDPARRRRGRAARRAGPLGGQHLLDAHVDGPDAGHRCARGVQPRVRLRDRRRRGCGRGTAGA